MPLIGNARALSYIMEFQEFVKTKSYSAPDAIAALDCGFKFYPEWRPAIKQFLSHQGCPLIFTEFNQGDQVRYGLLIYLRMS